MNNIAKEEKSDFFNRQKCKLSRFFVEYKIPLIVSLVAGLLAYVYMFTNKIPIGDELGYSFSKGATVTSGRWGLKILYYLIPNYSMPWLWGILSLVFFSVSICIILKTLEIKDKFLQIALAAVFVTFPSFADTFAFMFTSFSYAIALLFAVLAAYFFKKSNENKKYLILTFLLTVATLSIYQAFVTFVAGMAILLLIQMSNTSADWKTVFKKALVYLGILVGAVVVYMALTFLSLKVGNTEFNSYVENGIYTNPVSVPKRIIGLFWFFFKYLLFPAQGMVTIVSGVANLVLFVAIAVIYFIYLKTEIKNKTSILKGTSIN